MANDVLNVQSRITERKSDLSTSRRNGIIPGIYYTVGKEPISLNVNERELMAIIASGNVIIDMKVDDKDSQKIIIKDMQIHPVTDKIVHVDLMGIRMDKEIEISIPIHFEGVPEGVKLGGLQQSILRELLLKGLPADIPEVINLEIEHLDIGDSIHVHEINIPKVTIVTEAELAIVSVVTPKIVEEEVVEEELEGVEGEEGEEAVEGEGEGEGKGKEGEGEAKAPEDASDAPSDKK